MAFVGMVKFPHYKDAHNFNQIINQVNVANGCPLKISSIPAPVKIVSWKKEQEKVNDFRKIQYAENANEKPQDQFKPRHFTGPKNSKKQNTYECCYMKHNRQ